MRLRLLSLLFSASSALCALTSALNNAAGRLHCRLWERCTRENLRTLNVRRVSGRGRWG